MGELGWGWLLCPCRQTRLREVISDSVYLTTGVDVPPSLITVGADLCLGCRGCVGGVLCLLKSCQRAPLPHHGEQRGRAAVAGAPACVWQTVYP